MLSTISAALGYLIRSLKNPSAAGNSTESITVAIISITSVLKVIAKGFDQLFARQRKAYTAAQSDGQNIGTIVKQQATWEAGNWNHLLGVILPHSQSWLLGAVHKWADATFLRKSWLKSKAWTTVRSESHTAYTFWHTWHFALSDFFRKQWPALRTWQRKRAEPQLTQLWALNPKVEPLEYVILDKAANYLHSQRGATDLHNLTGLIIDESPSLWRHLETAALAFLNGPYN